MSDGLTVILSTYNRAAVLRETLESFCKLDLNNLDVEFVIVDNNSTDGTSSVIDEFKTRLPVHHLFELKQGKNCALNRALNEVDLAEFIIFTDDDVSPRSDWLQQAARAATRWQDVTVFGGPIEIAWPEGDPPVWAAARWIQGLGWAHHHLGDGECDYGPGSLPAGANLCIRRSIFDGGMRYDESIGPRPTNRIMGSETSLLIQLRDRGIRMRYIPEMVIYHRVRRSELNRRAVRERAFRLGKSQPYFSGRVRQIQQESLSVLWWAKTCWKLMVAGAKLSASYALRSERRRVEVSCGALVRCGIHSEALKIALRSNRRATSLQES